MLDERLSLAASLYEPCEWGADIGTDHGHLPCYLLHTQICRNMIAADVSPGSLQKARDNLTRAGLADRAVIALADGLDAIDRPCGCISIMGMGGITMAAILRNGKEKLQGAVLVLSAHTDQELVRQVIGEIGYHITAEQVCEAAGRFYVFWRAEPGAAAQTSEELRYGSLLWQDRSPLLAAYTSACIAKLERRLRGLQSAQSPDQVQIAEVEADIAYYKSQMEGSEC